VSLSVDNGSLSAYIIGELFFIYTHTTRRYRSPCCALLNCRPILCSCFHFIIYFVFVFYFLQKVYLIYIVIKKSHFFPFLI